MSTYNERMSMDIEEYLWLLYLPVLDRFRGRGVADVDETLSERTKIVMK